MNDSLDSERKTQQKHRSESVFTKEKKVIKASVLYRSISAAKDKNREFDDILHRKRVQDQNYFELSDLNPYAN